MSLIREVDEVSVPHLGTFYAELMPASFSDQGFTINPPYRRLSFRSAVGDDHALVDCYCSVNKVDNLTAMDRICSLSDRISKELEEFRSVEFPGLGKLRITKDNTVFFVPEPELDIFPEGIGLEPVSLRAHVARPGLEPDLAAILSAESAEGGAAQDMTSQAQAPAAEAASQAPAVEAVSQAPAAGEPSAEEPQASSENTAPQVAEAEPKNHKSRKSRKGGRKVLRALLVLLILALVVLAAFMLAVRFAPDFVDSILYTPEELLIINS